MEGSHLYRTQELLQRLPAILEVWGPVGVLIHTKHRYSSGIMEIVRDLDGDSLGYTGIVWDSSRWIWIVRDGRGMFGMDGDSLG